MNLSANLLEGFFGEKAAIEDSSGAICDTGSLRADFGLATKDGVHVDACIARSGRFDRYGCLSSGEGRLQFVSYSV